MISLILAMSLFGVNWNSDTSTTKPVLIYYHTEWCGYCKLMESRVFNDTTVSKIIDEKYTPIKVDCDSKTLISVHGIKIPQRKICSDNRIHAYPTIILYNSNLIRKKEYLGSSTKREFLKFIKK